MLITKYFGELQPGIDISYLYPTTSCLPRKTFVMGNTFSPVVTVFGTVPLLQLISIPLRSKFPALSKIQRIIEEKNKYSWMVAEVSNGSWRYMIID